MKTVNVGAWPTRRQAGKGGIAQACLVLTVCLLSAVWQAQAATVTWDGSNPELEATWTTDGNWYGGVAPSAGDSLVFGASSSANANDFPRGTAFASITFTNDAWDLGGLPLNLTGPGPAVFWNPSVVPSSANVLEMPVTFTSPAIISNAAPASALIFTAAITNGGHLLTVGDVAGGTVILNGRVTGSGGLTKQGAGALQLGNQDNDYAGSTTVAAGTLVVGAGGAVPSGAGFGDLVVQGTLDLNGNAQVLNGVSGTGIITNSSATLAHLGLCGKDVSATITFDGLIQGPVELTKYFSEPTLVLTRANTYSGATIARAGILRLGINNALPPGTSLTLGAVTNDVVLDLAGYNQQLAGLMKGTNHFSIITNSSGSSDSTLIFSNSVAPSTYIGRIVDGALRKVKLTVSGGSLTLHQADSTYTGLTLVTNSGSQFIIWTGPTGGGPFTVGNGATLGVTLGASNGVMRMSSLTLGASSTDQETLAIHLGAFRNPTAAPITATNLSANGTVTINISGTRIGLGQFPLIKYSGAIGGGGFAALALGSLPPGASGKLVNNKTNSSVDLDITSYVGSLVWTGEAKGAAASAWDIGLTADWADVVSGVAAVYTQTGASGPLVLFDDSASNAVVKVTTDVKPFSVTFDNTNLNYTIGGAASIGGTGSLLMEGAGSVTLASSNTYSGDTVISAGILRLGANGAIPGGAGKGNVTIDGTLDLAGFNDTINGLSGAGVIDATNGEATLTVGDNDQTSAFSGVIQNSGGTLSLTKTGAGTLTLSGLNTYAGATKVLGGTLATTTAGQPAGPLTVGNGASLSITASGPTNRTQCSSLVLGDSGSARTTNNFNLGGFGNPADPVIYATNLTVNGLNWINITGSGFSIGQFTLIGYQGSIGGSGYSFSLGPLPLGLGAYLTNAPGAVQLVITDPATYVWTGNENANWDIDNSPNWQLDSVPITYADGDTVRFDSTGSARSQVNLVTGVAPAGVTVDTSAKDYTFGGPGSLTGPGGLTKLGAGTLTLSTSNTFTGSTQVKSGVLKLGNGGALSGSASVLVASNAVLDASALGGGLIVGNNDSLGGYGTILGAVTIAPGGSLIPGAAPGTLSFSAGLIVQGNATVRISKHGKVVSSNQVAVAQQLTFDGPSALTVLYEGDPLVGGEKFQLFKAATYDGSLYSWSLPPLGPGLNWSLNRLLVDGSISVNVAPVPGTPGVQPVADVPLYLNVANLLSASSDPEGGLLMLAGVGTPSHGTATLDSDGTTLIYTPDPGYTGPDRFTYTISDGQGGFTTATNLVQVTNPNNPLYNQFRMPVLVGGELELRFAGFPGDYYTIQRSTNLAEWVTVLTQAIPSNGLLSFQDTTLPSPPPAHAFYRAVFELGTVEDEAAQIIQATGVKGGFIAHVGCGNGQLTAALQLTPSYRVQGLDQNPANVAAAREYMMSLGVYGYVSADQWDGAHLPYVDNFVNLAVVQDMGTMTTNEVTRVLAPLGVAYIQQGGSWLKLVKPRPPEIDDWTHYAYDATGSCVAQDTVVGPPKRYQWLAGPRFNRHHDVMSSFNAGVSANGRLFHVMDEGSRESILLPPKWSLIARDGFNGTLLWKRSISSWHPSMYGLKSGPTELTRRLVAVGDVVYVTLDYYGPVVALDAATGATLQTYDQTTAAQEIYWSGGTLFVVVDPAPKQWAIWENYYNTGLCLNTPSTNWNDHARVLTAINPTNGAVLWTNPATVYPTSIAVDSTGLVFHDGTNINKLDRNDGHLLWRSSAPVTVLDPTYTANGSSMIIYQDTVLMAGGPGPADTPQNENQYGFIWSVDSSTGNVLAHWVHGRNSHEHAPNDLFLLDNLVWSTAAASTNPVCIGYDRRNGLGVRTNNPHLYIDWIHERCYRSKATVNYFLTSRACLEVIDTKTGVGVQDDWVRAACLYGFIPCNGLIYTTPNDCSCQFTAKLTGLGALAPASADTNYPPTDPDSVRLQPGPAYTEAVPSSPSPDDWPTYRHDAVRSGYTTNAVSTNLKLTWQTALGGRLSSVTVAEGALFVASVDTHTVYALDADTGSNRWSFTAGGRVDSPPTIDRGRVFFGSADGYAYCLRATDGALIWRFLVAPTDLRHMSYEQVESVWPVSGSLLVLNDKVYCVAGRSMYLDGGCRFVVLNPTNGLKLIEKVMNDKIPGTTNSLTTLEKTFNAPVALPDLLSSDGQHIFMKSQWFDLDGVRTNIAPVAADVRINASWANQIGEGVHLFTPTGFLDDSWMHRSYWVWGKSWSSGAGGYYIAGKNAPCGQILCIDESNVYGFGRMPQYYKWTLPKENMLFSTGNQNNFYMSNPFNWTNTLPFLVKAMAATQTSLVLAGPPELEDEEQPFSSLDAPQTQTDLANENAALHGSQGGQLRVVDKATGNTLAASSVNFLPAWDGMAVAKNSVYLASRDGRVVCLR